MYKKMFSTAFLDMFTIYFYTKFHMPSSNSSLITATKPKAKYRFCTVIVLFFYIIQKNYLNKCCVFFEDLLPYKISEPYIKCDGIASLLVVLMVGN
jgi:hypothetical protein